MEVKFEFKNLKFQKFSDKTEVENLNSYVKEFMIENPNSKIVIGSDSHKRGKNYVYSSVVALFYPSFFKKKGLLTVDFDKGAHLVYTKNIHKFKHLDIWTRLSYEAEYSIVIANALQSSIPSDQIEIHLDFNQDKFYKSNKVYQYYYGYIQSLGYKCIAKPSSWVASCAADLLAK